MKSHDKGIKTAWVQFQGVILSGAVFQAKRELALSAAEGIERGS